MKEFYNLYWGIIARLVNFLIPVQKKYWVFGSDYGKTYREGAKYLLEYMLKEHPDYHCVFITQNRDVVNQLNSRNIECYLNHSINGIIAISRAERIFTCQYLNDIRFVFKKKGRSFFYLLHGMPYKLAMNALPDSLRSKQNFTIRLKNFFSKWFVIGYKMSDVSLVTSDFLVDYADKDFGHRLEVKVLGMPRNDALFDHVRMMNEKWLEGLSNKFIITYMPTHRAYGRGKLSPILFEN